MIMGMFACIWLYVLAHFLVKSNALTALGEKIFMPKIIVVGGVRGVGGGIHIFCLLRWGWFRQNRSYLHFAAVEHRGQWFDFESGESVKEDDDAGFLWDQWDQIEAQNQTILRKRFSEIADKFDGKPQLNLVEPVENDTGEKHDDEASEGQGSNGATPGN